MNRFGWRGLAGALIRRFSRILNEPTAPGGGRQQLGKYGEDVAAAWLRGRGCAVLARNFAGPHGGEVDIVARDGRLLLFVEVKSRQAGALVRGFDAVGKEKQRLIERGANAWLRALGTRQLPWRFDIIEVTVQAGEIPRVNWIKDAF